MRAIHVTLKIFIHVRLQLVKGKHLYDNAIDCYEGKNWWCCNIKIGFWSIRGSGIVAGAKRRVMAIFHELRRSARLSWPFGNSIICSTIASIDRYRQPHFAALVSRTAADFSGCVKLGVLAIARALLPFDRIVSTQRIRRSGHTIDVPR